MSLPVLNFDKISFSEANRLAFCEKQWDFQYNREGFDFEPTQAMSLGKVLHTLFRAWWDGGNDYAHATLNGLQNDDPESWANLDEEKQMTAVWLLDRYNEYYGPWQPTPGLQSEVHIAARYKDVILHAYFDHMLENESGLWLVERKTMSQWNRLDILPVDPQITTYVALARMAGYPVKGVLYDAIRTYRWKRDDRAPAESFERVWLDRTDTQIEQALKDLDTVLERRTQLRNGARPIRNLGPMSCRGCSFKEDCFEELAFGNDIELVD